MSSGYGRETQVSGSRRGRCGEVSLQLTAVDLLSLAVNVVQNGWNYRELPIAASNCKSGPSTWKYVREGWPLEILAQVHAQTLLMNQAAGTQDSLGFTGKQSVEFACRGRHSAYPGSPGLRTGVRYTARLPAGVSPAPRPAFNKTLSMSQPELSAHSCETGASRVACGVGARSSAQQPRPSRSRAPPSGPRVRNTAVRGHKASKLNGHVREHFSGMPLVVRRNRNNNEEERVRQ